MNIGDRLRRARLEAGITQVELSRLTGIRQPVISAYESGARTPSKQSCERILTSLGIRPSVLLARHRDRIRSVLAERGVTDVAVFGSTVRGTDDEGSDLDLLVRLPDGTSLFDLFHMETAVEEIVGIDVDLLSTAALDDDNPAHAAIREEAVPL